MTQGIHFHCACAFHELTCRNLYSGTGACAGTHTGTHTGTLAGAHTGTHTGTLTGTHTGTLAGARNWSGCSSNCWAVTTTPQIWEAGRPCPQEKGVPGHVLGPLPGCLLGQTPGHLLGQKGWEF